MYTNSNEPGSLCESWVVKKRTLPNLTFLNSRNMHLYGSLAAQSEGLPLPLPILDPITFFVTGIWGKILNQRWRLVTVERLTAFFKKSFILKRCLLKIKKWGFLFKSPDWPYIKCFFFEKVVLGVYASFIVFSDLFLWVLLKVTFLGRNNSYWT